MGQQNVQAEEVYSKGRGVVKCKIFKGKFKAKQEFPEEQWRGGGGGKGGLEPKKKKKKTSVDGVWMFSGTTQYITSLDNIASICCAECKNYIIGNI